VSDERGDYRLPKLPPGKYKMQAELTGFATVVFPSIELLVGQTTPGRSCCTWHRSERR